MTPKRTGPRDILLRVLFFLILIGGGKTSAQIQLFSDGYFLGNYRTSAYSKTDPGDYIILMYGIGFDFYAIVEKYGLVDEPFDSAFLHHALIRKLDPSTRTLDFRVQPFEGTLKIHFSDDLSRIQMLEGIKRANYYENYKLYYRRRLKSKDDLAENRYLRFKEYVKRVEQIRKKKVLSRYLPELPKSGLDRSKINSINHKGKELVVNRNFLIPVEEALNSDTVKVFYNSNHAIHRHIGLRYYDRNQNDDLTLNPDAVRQECYHQELPKRVLEIKDLLGKANSLAMIEIIPIGEVSEIDSVTNVVLMQVFVKNQMVYRSDYSDSAKKLIALIKHRDRLKKIEREQEIRDSIRSLYILNDVCLRNSSKDKDVNESDTSFRLKSKYLKPLNAVYVLNDVSGNKSLIRFKRTERLSGDDFRPHLFKTDSLTEVIGNGKRTTSILSVYRKPHQFCTQEGYYERSCYQMMKDSNNRILLFEIDEFLAGNAYKLSIGSRCPYVFIGEMDSIGNRDYKVHDKPSANQFNVVLTEKSNPSGVLLTDNVYSEDFKNLFYGDFKKVQRSSFERIYVKTLGNISLHFNIMLHDKQVDTVLVYFGGKSSYKSYSSWYGGGTKITYHQGTPMRSYPIRVERRFANKFRGRYAYNVNGVFEPSDVILYDEVTVFLKEHHWTSQAFKQFYENLYRYANGKEQITKLD